VPYSYYASNNGKPFGSTHPTSVGVNNRELEKALKFGQSLIPVSFTLLS